MTVRTIIGNGKGLETMPRVVTLDGSSERLFGAVMADMVSEEREDNQRLGVPSYEAYETLTLILPKGDYRVDLNDIFDLTAINDVPVLSAFLETMVRMNEKAIAERSKAKPKKSKANRGAA